MKVRLNLHGTEIVIDDLTTDEASALISNLIKNIDDNGNEQGEATLTVDEIDVDKSFERATSEVPRSEFTISTDTDTLFEFDANDLMFNPSVDLNDVKFCCGTVVKEGMNLSDIW